jgi:hypothetical protein
MHVVLLDDRPDREGKRRFVAFWAGAGAIKRRAQHFHTRLEDFCRDGTTRFHSTEEAAFAAAWGGEKEAAHDPR